MKTQALAVTHHSRTVHGKLYLPDSDGKHPIVIFSHGYNGCADDFAGTAEYFADHGVASACITFCGGSTRDTSGFPTTSMTLFTEVEDLTAVIDETAAHGSIDSEKIFLFGASMGGLVSAMTAREQKDRIRGILLLFPAFCIADNWNSRFPNLSDIPETVDFWGMTLGHDFFATFHGRDLCEDLADYHGDVLIMHGDRDPVVPVDYSTRIVDAYDKAHLEIFVGEGHGFSHPATLRMEGMSLCFVHRLSER